MSKKQAKLESIDWRDPESYLSSLATAEEWSREYARHAVFLFPDFTRGLRNNSVVLPDPDLNWGQSNSLSRFKRLNKLVEAHLGAKKLKEITKKTRDGAKKNYDPDQLEFLLESLPVPGEERFLPEQIEPDELGIIVNLKFSADHTIPQIKYLIQGAQKNNKISPEKFENPLKIDGELARRCLQTWDARALDVTFEKIGEVTHRNYDNTSWAPSANKDYQRALKFFAQFEKAELFQYQPGSAAITDIF